MFDIGWSELLLIAAVAFIVVGPKELPVLLRTVGRYVGIIRGHALKFRAQIDEAIKDTELEELRDEMTDLRDEVTGTMRETSAAVGRDMDEAKRGLETAGREKPNVLAERTDDSEV